MNYHPVVLFLFATAVLSKIRISPSHEDDIIVKTNHGQLRGRRDETISGTPYFSFQGIPYATPPVKSKRFEPPKSMSWRGIWNATYIRPNCTQLSLKSEADIKSTMNGDEDCLYMNIYTTELPDKENRTQRPVLVWIHGGGFIIGAGEMPSVKFDPFIDQKVVTVNFNYRLGVFGFLSTGDDVLPGNMGVKDLILALRWVQENIAWFSGDPKSVTIMGESAGAALVSYLIESPLAKGLFHKAIMESGNTYAPWATTRTARENTLMLGRMAGVFNGDIRAIIRKLKVLPTRKLHTYSTAIMMQFLLKDPINGLVYTPVLERKSNAAALSIKSNLNFRSCEINSVPIIIGFNSAEAELFFEPADILPIRIAFGFFLAKFDFKPEKLAPLDIQSMNKCFADEIGYKIKNHYAGPLGSFALSINKIIKYSSDYFFVVPTTEYIKSYAKCNPNVYFYRFSYTGGRKEEILHQTKPNSELHGLVHPRKTITRIWKLIAS